MLKVTISFYERGYIDAWWFRDIGELSEWLGRELLVKPDAQIVKIEIVEQNDLDANKNYRGGLLD